jgi:hypothetical protein
MACVAAAAAAVDSTVVLGILTATKAVDLPLLLWIIHQIHTTEEVDLIDVDVRTAEARRITGAAVEEGGATAGNLPGIWIAATIMTETITTVTTETVDREATVGAVIAHRTVEDAIAIDREKGPVRGLVVQDAAGALAVREAEMEGGTVVVRASIEVEAALVKGQHDGTERTTTRELKVQELRRDRPAIESETARRGAEAAAGAGEGVASVERAARRRGREDIGAEVAVLVSPMVNHFIKNQQAVEAMLGEW